MPTSISVSTCASIYTLIFTRTASSIFIFLHPHPPAPIRPCAQATEYTCSIDVWSYACVLAELLLGGPIFRGESNADQLLERARARLGGMPVGTGGKAVVAGLGVQGAAPCVLAVAVSRTWLPHIGTGTAPTSSAPGPSKSKSGGGGSRVRRAVRWPGAPSAHTVGARRRRTPSHVPQCGVRLSLDNCALHGAIPCCTPLGRNHAAGHPVQARRRGDEPEPPRVQISEGAPPPNMQQKAGRKQHAADNMRR